VLTQLIGAGRIVEHDELLMGRAWTVADQVEALLARLGPDEPTARKLLRALANGPAAGYTVHEWATAVSPENGRGVARADLDRLLPALEVLLTTSQEERDGPRYLLIHAALHDHFSQ
jgi:hypothetical protein